MKRILCSVIVLLTLLINAYALKYALPTDEGVCIIDGMSPVPEEAIWPIPSEYLNVDGKYLNIKNKKIELKDAAERLIMELPLKYRKKVDGVWVEKIKSEKNTSDTQEDQSFQTNKVTELKIIENQYVTFLTNEWKQVLIDQNITNLSNVINVPYTTHMKCLGVLKSKDKKADKPTYTYFKTEFLLFKDLIISVNGDIDKVGYHSDL